MIHAYIELQDTFSFAYVRKIVTVSQQTFDKQVAGIGATFGHFDKKQQIRSNYKVLIVRKATEQDYINTNTKQFFNS